ncbi:MAG TPA: CAP domain-containing protein, partial [Thermosynechococcaceae cyanobacterium]
GVACGDHSQREMMCLSGLANQYTEQDGSVAVTPTALPKPAPNQPELVEQRIVTNASANVTNPAEEVSAAIVPKPFNSESSPSQPQESKARSVIAILTDQELRTLEQDIIAETNRLRANPSIYADELEELKQYYKGDKGKKLQLPNWTFQLETVEGIAAVDEAIQDLRQTSALESLTYSQGMSAGAGDHLQDLIRNNLAGHIGSNGDQPLQRVQRYGQVADRIGENISYSPLNTARHHLSQLLIDDDVPNRGHRKALLAPHYRVMGIACGIHPNLGHTCVMTYTDGYKESKQRSFAPD